MASDPKPQPVLRASQLHRTGQGSASQPSQVPAAPGAAVPVAPVAPVAPSVQQAQGVTPEQGGAGSVAAENKPQDGVRRREGVPPAAPSPATPGATVFELPAAVYSPQLLESVIYDLQYYLDWIRQNHIRQQVGAHPKDEPNHSDETALVIEAWLGDKPATLESIEALHDHLKHLKLPEVHLMLAALPNRTQRETLVKWFRNNATSQLLISFVADRNLGGGIVVRTPNRLFDYTWKQQLVAGRSHLAEIVHRV